MLYLNSKTSTRPERIYNLTLTSVVFECTTIRDSISIKEYLTLTSVVFEFCIISKIRYSFIYLTLTSVVFEW